jgi:hypothetical protein
MTLVLHLTLLQECLLLEASSTVELTNRSLPTNSRDQIQSKQEEQSTHAIMNEVMCSKMMMMMGLSGSPIR